MHGTEVNGAPSDEDWSPGGALPDFTDLDLAALSRSAAHPVLKAVAASVLHRVQDDASRAVAFYEDSPYQL